MSIRIPEGVRLPIVVTDEWLMAATAAGWRCQCQTTTNEIKCDHLHRCEHRGDGPAAYRLVLEHCGQVLCLPCSTKRARSTQRHARQNAAQAAAAAQPSLFDLIETGEAR